MQKSLKTQVTTLSIIIFLLLLGLGSLSIVKLNDVNQVSSDIRDHWLQSTRILGDLNNFTSDYRATEASLILAESPDLLMHYEKEIRDLNSLIASSENSYEQIHHKDSELETYKQFRGEWESYLTLSNEVLSRSRMGNKDQASKIHMAQSRIAFATASNTLSKLTAQTVKGASDASARSLTTYAESQNLIILALLLTVISTAIMLAYTSKFVAVPLLELANAMRSLAANNTNINIPGIDRHDEIGNMAQAVVVFQKNAITLNQNQLKLIQQASTLEEKLQSEQRMTELQRNFISMVSHEFRTPLTIIDGQAQRLIKMKEPISSIAIIDRSEKIRGAVLRLTKVMDRIQTSSNLYKEQSKLPFQSIEIDPIKLLKDVCHIHQELTPSAKVSLNITPPIPTAIFGDHDLLFLAISNLISNAIKYSTTLPTITIDALYENEMLIIKVRDQGIGIPQKDMNLLFERYHRGSNVAGIEGTGIGLHLVKMVASLHQGDVSASSTEGQGSEFIIRVPHELKSN